ncbi:hypothetical protein PsYK624_066970 [Phanerochaete sordida]|uniref:Fucose-specific lectin n=1 Tax=Phanerochaete sordida TaxID=48140 RepID=A0A9P3GAW8_9APHY|nr:hypothetical protein PsYK624_066970 [Phanerochaete sordida]
MSLPSKSVTLTAGRHLADIRCYRRGLGGDILHAPLDLDQGFLESSVQQGFKPKDVGWSALGLKCEWDEDSSLCSVTWSATSWSLFYQDKQENLREILFQNDGVKPVPTPFRLPGVKAGTNIAAATGLGGGRPSLLFFQGKDGLIRYCAVDDKRQSAGTSVVVANIKGAPLTSIGACVDNDAIRVYFQDTQYSIQEASMNTKGEWTLAKEPLSKGNSACSLNIISGSSGTDSRSDIRVYAQDLEGTVTEFKRTSRRWESAELRTSIKPLKTANIVAVFAVSQTYRAGVLWIGEDNRLYIVDYRSDARRKQPQALVRLIPPSTEPEAQPTKGAADGHVANGSAIAAVNSNINGAVPHYRPPKVIKDIRMSIAGHVDNIKIVYDDGKDNGVSYRATSGEQSFALAEGEYITHIWYSGSGPECLRGVLFGTSNGRTSGWFGSGYGPYGVLNKEKHVLLDLRRTTVENKLNAPLTADWVEFTPTSTTAKFEDQYTDLHNSFLQFQAALAKLKTRADDLEAVGTEAAAVALAELVEDVEILGDDEGNIANAQVVVTSQRQRRHDQALANCRKSVAGAQAQLEALALELAPLAGSLDTAGAARRGEGEELFRQLVKLKQEVEARQAELNALRTSLASNEKLWIDDNDKTKQAIPGQIADLTKVMVSKGVKATAPAETTPAAILTWLGSLDTEAVRDPMANPKVGELERTQSLVQYNDSQITFLRQNQKTLAAQVDQLGKLPLDTVIDALRKLIDSLHNVQPSKNVAIKDAIALMALAQKLAALLQTIREAERSQQFAGVLTKVLESLVENTQFKWSAPDGAHLLEVSRMLCEE